jgi:hypothetical protein
VSWWYLGVTVATTAYAGIKKSQAEKAAGVAANDAAGINAAMQEAQADQDELDAQENIARTREEGRKYQGTQAAQIAASGVLSTEGSPLDAIVATAGALALRQADMARTSQAQTQAAYALAAETRRTGKLKERAYRDQASGTLLSSASQAFGTYQSFRPPSG